MSHWFIAGASRGIGLELARQLARSGERVTGSVRDAAGGARLATALEGYGGRVLTFDTRDEAAIRVAAALLDEPIDALIVNAGAYGPRRQSSTDMDFDGALDLLNVNALGPLRVAQAFLHLVKRGDHPRIILMSSALGSLSLEGTFNVAYRASKAALNKITQCLAQDLKAEGVSVIALHPGWVRTDMGGPDAPLSVEDSAAGIIDVVEALTIAGTGRYVDYSGEEIDW